MPITKLENLLKSSENSNLEKVIQRAQTMDTLTTAVRAGLPVELAENLIAANLRDDGELVLLCSTSAWAARLRFETDSAVDAIEKQGHTVDRCQVKVERQ